MNSITTRVFSQETAKKLADLYLPVHLRDFYLGMSPLIQYYLYSISSRGDEFFSLVLMEHARFHNHTMDKGRIAWDGDPQFGKFMGEAQEVIIELSAPADKRRISMDKVSSVENSGVPALPHSTHHKRK